MEENNKNGNCPHCQVSDDTIQKLKDSAQISKKAEYDSKKHQKEAKEIKGVGFEKAKKIIIWTLLVLLFSSGIFFLFNSLSRENQAEKLKITVFLSPTCSCCQGYVDYLRSKGFQVEKKQTNNMLAIKEQYQIPEDMEACHTSVIGDYFIEGHMPVQFIEKLLEEKPEIDGIALPGMPQGAPGMSGLKGSTIKIYSLKNGVSSEFANW